jgi:hypothetical protein
MGRQIDSFVSNTLVRHALPLLFVACVAILDPGRAMAQPAEHSLVVRLISGRQFTGAVDRRSSTETLVLRTISRGMTVRRTIEWERIASAMLDGGQIEVAELRARVKEFGTEDRGQRTEDRAQESGVGSQQSVEPDFATQFAAVASVAFDARIANWDADVETDGLIVELMPVDGEGYLAPASGTVEIELFAPQRHVFHHVPQSGGDTLELVERWTRNIRAVDFTANGVRLRLPFGAVHPEFDSDWLASHYGLVHVRLAAPGHGVFDASRDGLRIRPWAPNRDQLELKEFPRFLPTESVGRRN